MYVFFHQFKVHPSLKVTHISSYTKRATDCNLKMIINDTDHSYNYAKTRTKVDYPLFKVQKLLFLPLSIGHLQNTNKIPNKDKKVWKKRIKTSEYAWISIENQRESGLIKHILLPLFSLSKYVSLINYRFKICALYFKIR